MMAYDNLEDDVLLLHGLDDSKRSRRGMSDVGQERDIDALDVFTDALGDISGRRSKLDDIGRPGVGLTGSGNFGTVHSEMPPGEVLEDREKFVNLMRELASALKEDDSLGHMDDVSVSVVRDAANRAWDSLEQFGRDVQERFVSAVSRIKDAISRGNKAKSEAEKKERETRKTLEQWKSKHQDNRKKWKAMRNAVSRATGESGVSGAATQMDELLNRRGKLLERIGDTYNKLSRKRKEQTVRFEHLKGEVTGAFEALPGIGDLGIKIATIKKVLMLVGPLAAIVGTLYVINRNFDSLFSRSNEEREREEEVEEKLEEYEEKLTRIWDESKRVGYDPGVDEPYQEVRDDQGRIIGVRFRDKFIPRDVEEEYREDIEERERREWEREEETDEGMLSQMALPLVVGGVGIAALYVMTRQEGRATIRELRTPPPTTEGGVGSIPPEGD